MSVIIIDEAGPLELSGNGWSAALDSIYSQKSNNRKNSVIILSVRESLVNEVCARWNIYSPEIFNVNNIKENLTARIKDLLQVSDNT